MPYHRLWKVSSSLLLFFALYTLNAVAQNGGATAPDTSRAPEPAAAIAVSNTQLKDVQFPFNVSDSITNQDALQSNAEWLKAHPEARIRVEGYADERGEIVYNLGLAQKRADFTRDSLVKLGVPENSIVSSTGWGKLYPTCEQQDEQCWQQNRRSNFCAVGSCP